MYYFRNVTCLIPQT